MKETDNLKLKLPEENDWADVGALNENFRALDRAAGMCSSAETVDGAVRFWARKVPAENLEATLALLTPGTGELGAAGGGSAYVLPVATTETPAGVIRVRAAKTPEAEMSGEYWVMKGKG